MIRAAACDSQHVIATHWAISLLNDQIFMQHTYPNVSDWYKKQQLMYVFECVFSSYKWWKIRVVFFASITYFNLTLILQRGATFLTLSGHTSEPVKRFCGEPLFLVLRNSPASLVLCSDSCRHLRSSRAQSLLQRAAIMLRPLLSCVAINHMYQIFITQ